METVIQTYKTVQLGMEAAPRTVNFLHGGQGVYHTAMLAAAEYLRRKERVLIVDAANVTDPFFLAGLFKLADQEPEELLAYGSISRCYTFYQVDVTVTEGVPEFLRRCGASALFVFGLLDLIDDDQVPTADLIDMLQRMTATLKEVAAQGVPVLLASRPLRCQKKEREEYFTYFREIADVHYRLDSDHRRTSARRGRHGKTDRDRNAADRQRTGTVGELPPGPPQRRTGAFR